MRRTAGDRDQDIREQVQLGHAVHKQGTYCYKCYGNGTSEHPWGADCPGMKHQQFTK